MFNQNPDFQSPEEKAGIFIFLIFMFLIAMLCYGSTVKADYTPLSTNQSVVVQSSLPRVCHENPMQRSKQRLCTQVWHLNQQDEVNKISFAILSRLTYRIDRDGNPVYAPSCSSDHFGCEQRIQKISEYIVHESSKAGVDPWIVTALIWNETRFNPFAVSHVGTRGVMQLHPRNRRFSSNRFLHREYHRTQCRRSVGNCQAEVIRDGIGLLRDSIERCDGEVASGLTMYNAGRCRVPGLKYPDLVLTQRSIFVSTLTES